MSSFGGGGGGGAGGGGMSDGQARAMLDREKQRMSAQRNIQAMTKMCFEHCVSKPNSSRLSSTEKSCLDNCPERFWDTKKEVMEVLGLSDMFKQ